ncbi:DUF72 domain-containing protein [Janthinobacterium psychrotolerans]|uniref:Putative conserved protein YecE, DUF72 family n=1 Tax=Janthinobacterium psychrotolerans TaxID=1747903 RepID=A0A1A7C2U2_9BURK|nr:putative conserved protein YecE, DUF72 family [Janthinobacterium psychrotolerans]
MSTLHIGTAGWGISSAASANFPGEGSHLARYGRVFNCAEINTSFYRPHQPTTYARWADSVPDDFRFSVKLPRTITHELRLKHYAAELKRFASEAGELKDKLGCVLVQLPPSLRFESALADDFFRQLRDHFNGMLAFEARHASWFGDAATALLRASHITRVRADPPAGQPGPHVPTTEVAYIRLHGSPKIYYSDYAADFLSSLATELRTQAANGSWCIFDNTASGAALLNALDLQQRLQASYRVQIKTSGRNPTGKNGETIPSQPGMTATAEINTGRKTVLRYLTKPIAKTFSEAMGER